jgi:hypothetical protein
VSSPVSVRLTQATQKSLDALMARTGYNRTDAVNRAIQLYNLINEMPVGTILTITHRDVNEISYPVRIIHRTIRRRRPFGLGGLREP